MNHPEIIGTTYPKPEWTPLETLLSATPEILPYAMYLGRVETTAGIGHAYKHDETRRTLYVLPEMIAKYVAPEKGRPYLEPFTSPATALHWWQS